MVNNELIIIIILIVFYLIIYAIIIIFYVQIHLYLKLLFFIFKQRSENKVIYNLIS